jgi:arginyl-tRNA synthetase
MKEIKKLITSQLSQIIKEKLALEVSNLELIYPVFAKQGDLALACFAVAKLAAKSPVEIAQVIAESWQAMAGVSSVKADGPYVNFIIEPLALLKKVEAVAADEGRDDEIMIEFANVNTHKEFHIGHLRNVAYGQAVTGLLNAVGYKAVPVSYVNDFGIHVAKTIWQLKSQPIEGASTVDRGYQLGQAYVKAVARLNEDESLKLQVGQIMTEIEERHGENYALWQETRQWSIDYFKAIYHELGLAFADEYYESELIDKGKQLVEELLAKGILVKSRGAVIADLEAEDLGVLVLVREDGTALYPVADLALAMTKFADRKLAQSLYVVDKRQSLYFKQLFAVLKKMGYEAPMIHLPYDFVTLPSGMMSSRAGNTVLFTDLYEECKRSLELETRARHADWSEDKIAEVVAKLAVSTLKFEMIKVSAEKIITFDVKEALRFEGYTAAYLQYSIARMNSLLAKAGEVSAEPSLEELAERVLVVALAKYAETVSEAAAKHEPAILAQYLFEVAQRFNDFYQTCPILNLESESLKAGRLALVKQTRAVLTAGLAIFGIEVVSEM